jgi:3',5'-cyclic AMP phosphodiesterase CpdA
LTSRKDGTWKVLHETENRFQDAIEDINARGVSYVQFLGDLTSGGRREELQQFAAGLEGLDPPFGVIPGNHDVPKDGDGSDVPSVSRFEARFTSAGFPTVTPVGGLTLVGLNTAALPDGSLRSSWAGAVSDAQLARLGSVLASAEAPIVFTHHNLGPLPEHPTGPPWTWFPMKDASAVRAVLQRHDVKLAVSGHHHLFDRVSRQGITELYAPATCSFPQSYLLVEITPSGTEISLVPLATRAELEEAFWHASTGDSLGRSVLSMVETRLDRLQDTR